MKKSEFENVEFITIGDGAIRIQVAKIEGLNMEIGRASCRERV